MADNIDVDKLKKDALNAIDDLFVDEDDASSEEEDLLEDITQLEEDILTLDWEFSENQLSILWENLNSVADKYTDKYSQAMVNLLKKLVRYLYKSKDKAFPGTLNTMGYVVKSLKRINSEQMERSKAKAEFDATYQKVYSLKQKIEEYNADLVSKSKSKAKKKKSGTEEQDQHSDTEHGPVQEQQPVQSSETRTGAEEVEQTDQEPEAATGEHEEQILQEYGVQADLQEGQVNEGSFDTEQATVQEQQPAQSPGTQIGAEEEDTDQEPEEATDLQEEQIVQGSEIEAELEEDQVLQDSEIETDLQQELIPDEESEPASELLESPQEQADSGYSPSSAASMDQTDIYEKLEQFEQRIRYLEDQNRKLYNIVLSQEHSSDLSNRDDIDDFEMLEEVSTDKQGEIAAEDMLSEVSEGDSGFEEVEATKGQAASTAEVEEEIPFDMQGEASDDITLKSSDENISEDLSEELQEEQVVSTDEEEAVPPSEQEPDQFDSIGEYAEIVRFFYLDNQEIALPNENINNTYKLPGKLKKKINGYDSISLGKLASMSQKLSKGMGGDLAEVPEKELKNLTAEIYLLTEVDTKYDYAVLCSCENGYVIVPVSDQDKSRSSQIVEYMEMENDYSFYGLTGDMSNIPLIFPC